MARKSPTDTTGHKAQELAAAKAEELKARKEEISLLNAQAAEAKSEVVDLTEAPIVQKPAVEEVETVEVSHPIREFRVNSTIEHMTIGHGTDYTFEEGRTYRAPKHVWERLEELGYVWH